MRQDFDGPVASLTLDRPEKRNALSIELRFALAEALEALAGRDEVHCAVLTGAGSAFCAGMDVTQFGGDREHKERLVESSARAFDAVARFPRPLVAFVNGPAVAGGFALALLCDLRVAAPEARMGFPELGRHIPPSYAAARAALPEPLARELCLTGRLLDAQEAQRRGAVNAVGSRDDALALAREIAAGPPAATREVKRRALLHGERTWLPLLADELEQLRAALLG
ncbi:MAG TPA: enoyl-CoA hydratase/isomerase family protein [Solirubrobacteraceae bacterium]|nr:enoyl-CoA hydratase/isomerase family protein [Solirubrobacteraceae bacterium]